MRGTTDPSGLASGATSVETTAAVPSPTGLSAIPRTTVVTGAAPSNALPAAGSAFDEMRYAVTISGTVSTNNFRRSGEIVLRPVVDGVATQNGVNPFELCLRSGFPAGAPETGALWFGSNTACFPTRSDIDMVSVELNGNTYAAVPDAGLGATGVNGWTAESGLTACLYFPIEGRTVLTFDAEGGVEGRIDMVGFFGGCGAVGTRSTYKATVSGRRA